MIAAADREGRLKDGRVALLLHEQRNVLEGISVIYSETPADDLRPVAGQIICKPYARAEVFVVIARLLGHKRRRQGAKRGSRLEFLEGAAVGNIRSTDEVVILVPTNPKVYGQAAGRFPVILEVQTELLCIPDDEVRIADRDGHSVDSAHRCEAIGVASLVLHWSATPHILQHHP